MSYEVEFSATLFTMPGKGGWTFAPVPETMGTFGDRGMGARTGPCNGGWPQLAYQRLARALGTNAPTCSAADPTGEGAR
jgi:hypothetical protein